MKKENEPRSFSPSVAYYIELSIDFLHTEPVVFIEANEIPDDLLEAWIAPDPEGLLLRIANSSADANATLPYVVYTHAYKCHDRFYARELGHGFRTPEATVCCNFPAYQRVLQVTALLREQRIEISPLLPFNFANYLRYPPSEDARRSTLFTYKSISPQSTGAG